MKLLQEFHPVILREKNNLRFLSYYTTISKLKEGLILKTFWITGSSSKLGFWLFVFSFFQLRYLKLKAIHEKVGSRNSASQPFTTLSLPKISYHFISLYSHSTVPVCTSSTFMCYPHFHFKSGLFSSALLFVWHHLFIYFPFNSPFFNENCLEENSHTVTALFLPSPRKKRRQEKPKCAVEPCRSAWIQGRRAVWALPSSGRIVSHSR